MSCKRRQFPARPGSWDLSRAPALRKKVPEHRASHQITDIPVLCCVPSTWSPRALQWCQYRDGASPFMPAQARISGFGFIKERKPPDSCCPQIPSFRVPSPPSRCTPLWGGGAVLAWGGKGLAGAGRSFYRATRRGSTALHPRDTHQEAKSRVVSGLAVLGAGLCPCALPGALGPRLGECKAARFFQVSRR